MRPRRGWALRTTEDNRSDVDRRVAKHHRLIERRGGFERREPDLILLTLRDSRWVLVSLLVLLNALSIADGLLTSFELKLGIATESNPVFGSILNANPTLLAAGFKVAVMIA